MGNLIAVFEEIVSGDLVAVDCNFGSNDSVLVVFRRMGFELFDESGEEFLSDPSAFGEGLVGVGVRSDEPEGKAVDVLRLLLWPVLLHRSYFLL